MRHLRVITAMAAMTVALVIVTAVARPRIGKNTVYDKHPTQSFVNMDGVVGVFNVDPPAKQVLCDIVGGGEMCAFTETGLSFCDNFSGEQLYTLGLSTEPFARIVRLEFDAGPDGGEFSVLNIVR